MQYKVGDKVKVRNDLEVHKVYNSVVFTEKMKKFKGKTVTISRVTRYNDYLIQEDGENFAYSSIMLELKQT
tara:strand:- start:1003 stop:1215 length:213 start_codon:yes stop_codon:yes gene_type:complete